MNEALEKTVATIVLVGVIIFMVINFKLFPKIFHNLYLRHGRFAQLFWNCVLALMEMGVVIYFFKSLFGF